MNNKVEEIIVNLIDEEYIDGEEAVLMSKLIHNRLKKLEDFENVEGIVASLVDDSYIDGEDCLAIMKFIFEEEDKINKNIKPEALVPFKPKNVLKMSQTCDKVSSI